MLVGLTGGIGHGKTTFADLLRKHAPTLYHIESSDIVAEVANALRNRNTISPEPGDFSAINEWLRPLPSILETITHCTGSLEQLEASHVRAKEHPEDYAKLFEYLARASGDVAYQTELITQDTKNDYRTLLQWLGGYLVAHVSPDIWFAEIVRRLPSDPGDQLVTVGGLRYPNDARIVKQAGGIIVEILRPEFEDRDANDLTERQRNTIIHDILVINSGSLDDLENCAKQLYTDLARSNFKTSYTSSEHA